MRRAPPGDWLWAIGSLSTAREATGASPTNGSWLEARSFPHPQPLAPSPTPAPSPHLTPDG